MEMNEDERENLIKTNRWISDGLKAIKVKFLRDSKDADKAEEYDPEFVYQQLGDQETIFGYDGLKVTINYTDLSLHAFIDVTYSAKFKEDKGLKADDIVSKMINSDVRANVAVESKEEFQVKLASQKKFKPFGELISKFERGERRFELFKVTETSPEFDFYLERMQSISMLYIEGCSYTDSTDEQWMHYFVYESCESDQGDGSRYLKSAGYCSLYRFYAYPDKVRPRIAQMLLLPPYRKCGIGAKFLQTIISDLCVSSDVVDVSVESPGDNFVYLRDYVDCVNCLTLTEFSPQNLKKGFSEAMRMAALEKKKISKLQARRVYEILRFRSTNKKDKAELKEFRLDVKKRLFLPMKKSDKDWKRLNEALPKEELIKAAAGEMDEKQKYTQLQKMYDDLTVEYQKVIDRLEMYPTI